MFVQDQGDAVFLNGTNTIGIELGDRVRVQGVGAKGDFRPTVSPARIIRIGSGSPPEPIEINASDLKIGELDAKYVSIEGVIRRAISSMDHTVYLCEENGVEFHVSILGRMSVEDMWKQIGARKKFVGALGLTLKADTESDDVDLNPREIEMVRLHCMSQQPVVTCRGQKRRLPDFICPGSGFKSLPAEWASDHEDRRLFNSR